jgi:hypothetical protein
MLACSRPTTSNRLDVLFELVRAQLCYVHDDLTHHSGGLAEVLYGNLKALGRYFAPAAA